MSTRTSAYVVHPAIGGLDTSRAETLLEPGQLSIAKNIEYDIRGSRRKRPGVLGPTLPLVTDNGAGTTVTSITDYWRHGTSLTPTHQWLLTAGNQIKATSNFSTWNVLDTAGWGFLSARVHVTPAQGYLVLGNDLGHTPKKWDGTTLTDLNATALPKFEGCVYHLRRLFTFGECTACSGNPEPSRSNYSAGGDITTFTGADAGEFIFDEDDGDRLVGISKPFRGSLYFFKGPYRGSIHQISGRTPATFTKTRVLTGAPCVSHKSIVTTENDVYWCSPFGIHSLAATDKYGDTEEAYLSYPIQSLYRDVIDASFLPSAQGFHFPARNIIGWSIFNATGALGRFLVYNYRVGHWSTWEFAFSSATTPSAVSAVGVLFDSTYALRTRLALGGFDGGLYLLTDPVTQQYWLDNGTAFECRIRTPNYVQFGDGATVEHEKTLVGVTTFFRSVAQDATLTVIADGRSQTATIDMQVGGFILGTSLLGTGTLGGGSTGDLVFAETIVTERARAYTLDWSQTADSDLEIYGHAIRYAPAEGLAREAS